MDIESYGIQLSFITNNTVIIIALPNGLSGRVTNLVDPFGN